MADGAVFDISIEAESIGVDASAAELNALAAKIQQTNAVATQFDTAIAAARARLEEASAAARLAADALAVGEQRYKELESAANRAAKQVEKAAAAGKDTTALQAAADAAAAAMREQASVVDELRQKSEQAAAAQNKLADTLKVLEREGASAAAAMKKSEPAVDGMATAADALGQNEKVEQIKKLGAALSSAGGVAVIAAAAFVALTAATVGAYLALAKFAVTANAEAMTKLQAAQDRLAKGWKGLFSGVNLDKFVAAVEDLFSIFDEGTSTANALKVLFSTMLQPLFDAAAVVGPYVKEMFKGVVLGALLFTIAVLRVRNAIIRMIPAETRAAIKELIGQTVTMETAMKVGVAIAMTLAGVLAVLAATFVSIGISIAIAMAPMLLMIAAIGAVVAAFVYWDKIVAKVTETLGGWATAAKDAAKNLIDGLVNGIKAGVGLVVDALKGLASSGIAAFKKTLGIASPSKVFELQASHTVAGYVQGIEAGEDDVENALESMVSPALGAPAGGSSTSTSTSTSRAVHIGQLTINAPSGDAEAIAGAVKRALLELMEGATLTIGGGEAPAT